MDILDYTPVVTRNAVCNWTDSLCALPQSWDVDKCSDAVQRLDILAGAGGVTRWDSSSDLNTGGKPCHCVH